MKTVKCRTTLGHSLKAKGTEGPELPDLFKSNPKNCGCFCTTHFLSKSISERSTFAEMAAKSPSNHFLE